jgi:peroxiredoxin
MNAAVVEKLALPFPLLADPGRDRVIAPLGFADEKDPRQTSRPGTTTISP